MNLKVNGKNIFTGKIVEGKHEVRPSVEEFFKSVYKFMEENKITYLEIKD